MTIRLQSGRMQNVNRQIWWARALYTPKYETTTAPTARYGAEHVNNRSAAYISKWHPRFVARLGMKQTIVRSGPWWFDGDLNRWHASMSESLIVTPIVDDKSMTFCLRSTWLIELGMPVISTLLHLMYWLRSWISLFKLEISSFFCFRSLLISSISNFKCLFSNLNCSIISSFVVSSDFLNVFDSFKSSSLNISSVIDDIFWSSEVDSLVVFLVLTITCKQNKNPKVVKPKPLYLLVFNEEKLAAWKYTESRASYAFLFWRDFSRARLHSMMSRYGMKDRVNKLKSKHSKICLEAR